MCDGVTRNHKGRTNYNRQVDENSNIMPTSGCVEGGFNKGKMYSVSTFLWEKAVPPAIVLMPDNSLPSCMFLVTF